MTDWRDTTAGMSGSILNVMVGQPFDTTKVRMQTSPGTYSSVFSCLWRMTTTEGLFSLWKGAVPAAASAMTENAVVFTANGAIKRAWASMSGKDTKEVTIGENAVIGGLSGVFSATAICPPEVVKCRLQVQRSSKGSAPSSASVAKTATTSALPKYNGPVHCFVETIRAEGVRGVFRGWIPLLCRDVPFNFIFFGCYTLYTKILQSIPFPWVEPQAVSTWGDGKDDDGGAEHGRILWPLEILVAGGLAGSTAWATVFPADVVKSRLQVAGPDPSGGSTRILPLVKAMFRTGGIRVFYTGVSAAVMRAFPANGALFMGYEITRELLDKV